LVSCEGPQQGTTPDGVLDGERFGAVGADREVVAEMPADVGPGHLIQEQVAVADLALLGWRQGGDDEPVAR